MPNAVRAIIAVVEGAAPLLLDRWCEAGWLPVLRELRQRGRHGPLRGEVVPYEPTGLHSAFSGQPPGEHGWFSYWSVHPADYRPRVLTSADVTAPLLWRRPETSELSWAVVNVTGTHPPRPLHGHLISYPMHQTLRASFPDDLLRRLLRDQGISTVHDVSVWYEGQTREEFLTGVLHADQSRARAALHLLDEGAEVLVINLTAIDRVCHFYWQELEPGSPVPEDRSAIFRAYASCDRMLGQLLDHLPADGHLLTFSEIGFGPLRAYLSVNDALAAAELLWTTADEGGSAVDYPRSLAFEAVQGSHGVNVNLRGRYAEGRVAPADFERVRQRTREALEAAVNPHTGLPMFRRVHCREDLYAGAAAEAAPDLVVEPADERYQPLGDPYWAGTVNRTLQSGWHRRESFWAGVGPRFSAGEGSTATPLDVAPTVYGMLGLEPPEEWTGRDLAEAT